MTKTTYVDWANREAEIKKAGDAKATAVRVYPEGVTVSEGSDPEPHQARIVANYPTPETKPDPKPDAKPSEVKVNASDQPPAPSGKPLAVAGQP